MQQQRILISDETVIESLLSQDDDKLEAAQTFFNFLAYFGLKTYLTPKTFKMVVEKYGTHIDENISKTKKAYINNYFLSADFIGVGETTEFQDIESIIKKFSYEPVSIYYCTNKEIPEELEKSTKAWSGNIIELSKLLNIEEREFYDYIRAKYYDITC